MKMMMILLLMMMMLMMMTTTTMGRQVKKAYNYSTETKVYVITANF